MPVVNPNELASIISGDNSSHSVGSLFFRAPVNVSDLKLDNFCRTIFKSILVKYKINSLSDFHNLHLSSFKSTDFKRKTSLLGLTLYLVRHYGFSVCSSGDCEDFGEAFNPTKVNLSLDDFLFLSDKEKLVFKKRIVENKTLSVVGDDPKVALSRERVRQIEQRLKQYLKMFLSAEKLAPLNNAFESSTFVCSEDIEDFFETDIGLNVFKYLASGSQPAIIRDAGYYRYSRKLDIFSNNPAFGVLEVIEILKETTSNTSNIAFSLVDIKHMFNLDDDFDPQPFFSCLIKRNIVAEHDGFYFLYPTTKAAAVELYIALKKDTGYVLKKDFESLKAWIKDCFPALLKDDDSTFKKENFNSLIEHNKNIVLWGWGVYIHTSNIKKAYTFPVVSELKPLIEAQIKANSVANIKSIYRSVKKSCSLFNIPNAHALYTIARSFLSEDFDFKHSPWIRLIDTEQSIVSIIAESLKETQGKVAVRDIAKRFGIDTARATQLLSHSPNIVSAGRGFFKYEKNESQ